MKFLFVIFLLPLKLLAQDVAGVWSGTLYNDTTKQYIKYELAISEYNGKLSGYSHTIFVIDSVENIGVKSIRIKKTGDNYFIEDDKLIYNNYTEPPARGVKIYSELLLSQSDSVLILSGPWKTNTTKFYRSITGTILLKKKKKIEETLIIPKLQNLGLARSLSFMPYNNYSKEISNQKQDSKKEQTNLIVIDKPKADQNKIIDTAKTNSVTVINTTINKQTFNHINKIVSEDSTVNKKSNVAIFKNEKDNNKTQMTTSTEKKDAQTIKETVINEKKNIPSKELTEISPIKKDIHKIDIKEKTDSIKSASNSMVNKKEVAMVSKAAADISSRKIETIQSVDIKNDSLLLTLYDNGEIDGDTVSILLNGKVIMPLQGLTAKGINKTIYLTPEMGDSIVLIMYAENLGSIPPNTGLLIMYDGNTRHEIRFAGDLQKNSAIILKRKKLH